jgi:hypothetical protein
MNTTHYFQRYSQRENVVTNNTLLLLSRLYAHNPYSFEAFINECLDATLDVGISFLQQKSPSKKDSTLDGLVFQDSFKIVVETKLYENYDRKQLKQHLKSFDDEKQKILLLLARSVPNAAFIEKVERDVKRYNKKQNQDIRFVATTFEQIIDSFEDVLADFDYQMKELAEDFRAFLEEERLLPTESYIMYARTAGWSLQENLEFNLYYDLAYHSHGNYKYFGLYSNKCVRAIGEIENIIVADYDGEALEIHESLHPVTDDQKSRIIGIIPRAQERNNWDIAKDHRFFLVHQFYPTEYKKLTKYPIQRAKYFDLREVLGLKELPETAEIAELLKTKDW